MLEHCDASEKAIISQAIANNIDNNIAKYIGYDISRILKHCDDSGKAIITQAFANNIDKYSGYDIGRILKHCDASEKAIITQAVVNNIGKYDGRDLWHILEHCDDISSKAVILEMVTHYLEQIEKTLKKGNKLKYLWDKNFEDLLNIAARYTQIDSNLDEKCKLFYDFILKYQLHEIPNLYILKSEGKKERLLRSASPEVFSQYKAVQVFHRQLLEKRKLVSWNPDELSKKYHTIAQKHGIEIPEWLQIDEAIRCCSSAWKISINPAEAEKELVGILGHELGHIIAGDILISEYRVGFQPINTNLSFSSRKVLYNETEYAADRYSCMMSDYACLGLIDFFSREMDELSSKDQEASEIGASEIGASLTHSSHKNRIKKMRKILETKKRYDEGYCWNPLYKQVGGPKWYRGTNKQNN